MLNHPLFESPLVTRSFDPSKFKASQRPSVSPKGDAPSLITQPVQWSVEHGVSLALMLKGDGQRSNVEACRAWWNGECGPCPKEEAAFWLSLFCDDRFLYDYKFRQGSTVYDEAWILERCHRFRAETFAAAMQSKVNRTLVFQHDHHAEDIALFLRSLCETYQDGLDLMLDALEKPAKLCNWLRAYGPPAQSEMPQALAAIERYLDAQLGANPDLFELQYLLVDLLDVTPSASMEVKILESLLKDQVSVTHVLSPRAYSCLFHHPEPQTVLALVKKFPPPHHLIPEAMTAFLRYFEFTELDFFFEQFVDFSPTASQKEERLGVLANVDMPESLELMFEGREKHGFSATVTSYVLRDHIAQTAGLLALVERRGARRQWALDVLEQRLSMHAAEQDRIERLLPLCPPATQDLIKAEVLLGRQSSLPELPKSAWTPWMKALACRNTKVPDFEGPFDTWCPELEPQVRAADASYAFPLRVLLGMLWAQKSERHHGAKTLAKLRASKDLGDVLKPEDLEPFLCALFALWQLRKGGAEDLWFLPLIEAFGATLAISSLAAYLQQPVKKKRRWEASAHDSLQVICLNSLARIGTSGAIFQLRNCAHHGSKVVRRHAQKALHDFRQESGMGEEEFEDFLVPDFGLDAQGKRVFDYGGRQITMVVHGRQDIFFESSQGKKTSAIPPIRKSDDRTLANAAKQEYKLISKPLRQVLAEQNDRFEAAMLTRRTWSLDAWRRHIGAHPLLCHIARRLIWSVLDPHGDQVTCVMPSEDGSFVTLSMESFAPLSSHSLTPVHPLALPKATRSAWVEHLTDFEVIQPFDQMNRQIYLPEDATLAMLKAAQAADRSRFDSASLIAARAIGWRTPRTSDRGSDLFVLERGPLGDAIRLTLRGELVFGRNSRDIQRHSWDTSLKKIECVSAKGQTLKVGKKTLSECHPILFSEALLLLHRSLAGGKTLP